MSPRGGADRLPVRECEVSEKVQMQVIRVVIADDDATIRGALSDALGEDSRFAVVGTASTGAELEAAVDAVRPDVVLLDVRMPGGGPAGVTAVLSRHRDAVAGDRPATVPLVIAVSAETGATTVVA